LILKRAAASRPSGEWSDDDYDVLADGVVVGHVVCSYRRFPGAAFAVGSEAAAIMLSSNSLLHA
jgi:hypothetical protein